MPVHTYPASMEGVPNGVRTIRGVATSIALFIGWAACGPTDRAVRIASFADYEREFGDLDRRTLLPYAVKQFYDNGGADAYVVRIAAADAELASATVDKMRYTATSPGGWANHYSVRIARRAAAETARFRLDVIYAPTNNEVVESFEDLSVNPADADYVESMVNGRSRFITVTVDAGAAAPRADTARLENGEDGAVLSPADDDFRTAVEALFGPGTITDRIDLFNLVCVPGLSHDTTITTLQGQCRRRRAFLLVDCAEGETVSGMANSVASFAGPDAMNAALFFPWVRSPDALQQGALRHFPPCGYVAGVFARTDAQRGVWKAPAGSAARLDGAAGLVMTMSEVENGQLNPLGINCLRTFPRDGTVIWGSRTLHGDNARASEWKYVPVRRLALFLEESLYRSTQWVVREPNDEPLWAQIRLQVGAFMHDLFSQGAFQGAASRDAYFVMCDHTTTTQTDINRGIVNIRVGFAPLQPAEFVVITVQQSAGARPS